MQRHREGLLCEWRRLLLHTWYKSALLQVSELLCFWMHLESYIFTVNLSPPRVSLSCTINVKALHDIFTLQIFHPTSKRQIFILLFILLIALDFILLSFSSSSSSNTSQENAASLPNYPPVVYFNTNNGVRRWCAHPFKSCLVYRRAAH